MSIETRVIDRPSEVLRADGESAKIRGYAAVFYRDGDESTEYRLWGDTVERIAPGAFDRAIQENQDTLCRYNHDDNVILGRVSSGTLTLRVDNVGLYYECDPPASRAAEIESIERGDVFQSSFAFSLENGTERWEKTEGRSIRWLDDVDLVDVAPVARPAYEGTSSFMRAKESFDRWEAMSDEERAKLVQESKVRAEKVKIRAAMARI